MALDQIEAELTGGIPHKTCAVCHYLSERDAEWGKRLHALLANRGVKFKELAKALRDDPDEPNIPEKALSRHAQEGCLARLKLR